MLKAKRKESRTYPGQGTSVMLPLLPEDGYRVRVMAIGGGGVDREVFYQGGHNDDPSTNTVELLDLGAARPGWKFVASMHHPRVLCDSVLLPDGKVLVVGGSSTGKSDVAVDPVLPTELYDPATDTWTELAPINCAHLYHSTALLLPDGRVMRGGKDGQFQRDPYKYFEHRLELFSPPYLFSGAAAADLIGAGRRRIRAQHHDRLPDRPQDHASRSDPRRRGHPQLPHGPALRRAGDRRQDGRAS